MYCTKCGAEQNAAETVITEPEDTRPTTILVLGIIATAAVLTLMLVCLVLGSI